MLPALSGAQLAVQTRADRAASPASHDELMKVKSEPRVSEPPRAFFCNCALVADLRWMLRLLRDHLRDTPPFDQLFIDQHPIAAEFRQQFLMIQQEHVMA